VSSTHRERSDRCPGALRPWAADDGLLVRLRLIGGRVSATSVRSLIEVAEEYGDGRIHLTSRTNLQVRALSSCDGRLPDEVLAAVEATGLLPSRAHDLVRNVMVSPQTGLAGGRADLRPTATALDAALLAELRLGALPGRFLFVLDDGRGDLVDRSCDLGLVALDDRTAQLRIGDGYGPTVALDRAAADLAGLALQFLDARGRGPGAPWHVRELTSYLVPASAADPRLPVATGPLTYGDVPGGHHVEVHDGLLDRALVDTLTSTSDVLIVTPWHGVLVPKEAG
jgi:precorrin-3B synthase